MCCVLCSPMTGAQISLGLSKAANCQLESILFLITNRTFFVRFGGTSVEFCGTPIEFGCTSGEFGLLMVRSLSIYP